MDLIVTESDLVCAARWACTGVDCYSTGVVDRRLANTEIDRTGVVDQRPGSTEIDWIDETAVVQGQESQTAAWQMSPLSCVHLCLLVTRLAIRIDHDATNRLKAVVKMF